jgi:hypothetical protein
MQSNVQILRANLPWLMKNRAHPSRLSSRQTRLPIRANSVKRELSHVDRDPADLVPRACGLSI